MRLLVASNANAKSFFENVVFAGVTGGLTDEAIESLALFLPIDVPTSSSSSNDGQNATSATTIRSAGELDESATIDAMQ